MQGSILILGGNKSDRDAKILELVNSSLVKKNKNNLLKKLDEVEKIPDIKVIDFIEDKKSIGIAQTKEGIRFLQEKPFFYKQKILIIQNADKMTTEAQNSLLKILEEPPSTSLILLSSKNESSLLETVLSRCRKIMLNSNTKNTSKTAWESDIKEILKKSLGQRLDLAEQMASDEKEETVSLLEDWIEQERKAMLNSSNAQTIEECSTNLKLLLDLAEDLEGTNVSAKFALERLFLNLK